MDWTRTETTRYADVVLPGSTYLETAGTRCNFEGALVEYSRAVEPPSGASGDEVLRGARPGVRPRGRGRHDGRDRGDRQGEARGPRRASTGTRAKSGTPAARRGSFRRAPSLRPARSMPPLTHGEKYKREIREVGTDGSG